MGGLSCVHLKQTAYYPKEICSYNEEESYMDPIELGFRELNTLIRDPEQTDVAVKACMERNGLTLRVYMCHVRRSYVEQRVAYPPVEAICAGNLDKLALLCHLGFRFPNPEVDWIDPVLLYVCKKGDLSSVKSLVEDYGVDVNEGEKYGNPLAEAFCNGHTDVVRYLLENGCSVNGTYLGDTILHVTIFPIDMYECLIAHGADMDALDTSGSTPLHTTLRCGHFQKAYQLVKHGADMTIRNKKGDTAFILAYRFSLVCHASYNSEAKKKYYHDFWMFLLDAGYTPKDDERKILESADSITRQGITELLYTTRSLQDQCIFKIRHILKGALSGGADCLPVPTRVKHLIKLDHLKSSSYYY